MTEAENIEKALVSGGKEMQNIEKINESLWEAQDLMDRLHQLRSKTPPE